MTGRTLPTVGNLVVTEHVTHIEVRLRTIRAGEPVALFTYGELPGLIEILKGVRQPARATSAANDLEALLA